jgi:hypothetical protein
MAAAYTGPYQIHPLELPSNQNAAALINPAIVDSAKATWSSSPLGGGGAGQSSFGDQSTATRTTTAQAALAVEQSRLQGRADTLNRDITVVGTTP